MRRRDGLLGIAAAAFGLHARADVPDDPDAMYAALAAGPRTTLRPRGGTVDIVFASPPDEAQRERLLAWVDRALAAIVAYYGRFPIAQAGLLIEPTAGARVGHGVSFGYGGSALRVQVGRDTPRAVLDDDWVLIHELVHLAFPTLPRRHLWIEEGSATYVEPVARVQAGQMDAGALWSQFVRAMPQGQPQAGDRGMDRTQTWGRTYWGGALFCLLADVAARERTGLQRGLEDAMRAIARDSGGNAARWSLERAIAVGDAAIGAPVLAELHAQHAERAVEVDLAALWTRLGIVADAGSPRGVRFVDDAPQAVLRRAITQRRG